LITLALALLFTAAEPAPTLANMSPLLYPADDCDDECDDSDDNELTMEVLV
jgi:hypothetical protein